MDLPFLLFALFWWALGGRREPSQTSVPALPPPPPQPPQPWPQVAPTGLPAFPGPGWEFDEPPPPPVQARARQLLSQLWARGQGSWRVEQTAGRWIVYRAEITRGNKHGVVAYREKPPAPPGTYAPAPPTEAAPPTPTSRARPPTPTSAQPPPAPPAPPAATTQLELPTLRYGAGTRPAPPSADVRLLQNKLGITPDGQFGQQTLAAVKAFQRRRGLADDGIVGARTWTALFAERA